MYSLLKLTEPTHFLFIVQLFHFAFYYVWNIFSMNNKITFCMPSLDLSERDLSFYSSSPLDDTMFIESYS